MCAIFVFFVVVCGVHAHCICYVVRCILAYREDNKTTKQKYTDCRIDGIKHVEDVHRCGRKRHTTITSTGKATHFQLKSSHTIRFTLTHHDNCIIICAWSHTPNYCTHTIRHISAFLYLNWILLHEHFTIIFYLLFNGYKNKDTFDIIL